MGKLNQAIQHEQVVAGAALLMSTIAKHLLSELQLKKVHRSAMHSNSLGAIKLQPTDSKCCEIFEPVIAAMAMLGVGLQPTQLLPKRLHTLLCDL